MKSGDQQISTGRRSREELEASLEGLASKLLTHSLEVLGRGEYPFYSASYLRRLAATDQDIAHQDEAAHSEPPRRSAGVIWGLARKARLSSIETDVLRVSATGAGTATVAEVLGISRPRAARVLRRAVEKMREHAATVQESFEEELAAVLHEEQRRRGYSCEKHCKRGQEACRRTGKCPRRWYVSAEEM